MTRILCCLVFWAATAFGQGMPRYEEKVLQASTTLAAAATTNLTVTSGLNFVRQGYCLLKVTAITGTTPTLDIFLQGSPDTGATYCDYARFAQVTSTASTQKQLLSLTPFSIVGPGAGPAAAAANTCLDGTMTPAGSFQAGFGDRLRVKAIVAGTTPSVTFTITCQMTGL
jgi:hypothetical protein